MSKARETLILKNMNLVRWGVRKTSSYPIEPSERYSIGCESLIKAIDTYNPKYNTKLSCHFFNIYRKKLSDEVRRNRKYCSTVSMDAMLSHTDDGNYTLHDILPSDGASVPDLVILTNEYKELWEAVDSLPDEQRKIIRMRYSPSEYVSKRELAKRLGKSRPWVIKQEKAALKQCKELLSVKN